MLGSEAHVATPLAARYLGQLCKHFAHKIPASHTADAGRIAFDFGVCSLAAEPVRLVLRCEAEDEESLGRLEQVIASHLERFAFRDKLEVSWTRKV